MGPHVVAGRGGAFLLRVGTGVRGVACAWSSPHRGSARSASPGMRLPVRNSRAAICVGCFDTEQVQAPAVRDAHAPGCAVLWLRHRISSSVACDGARRVRPAGFAACFGLPRSLSLAPMVLFDPWDRFVETIGFTNVYLAADAPSCFSRSMLPLFGAAFLLECARPRTTRAIFLWQPICGTRRWRSGSSPRGGLSYFTRRRFGDISPSASCHSPSVSR